MGKFRNLPGPQFPYLYNRDITVTTIMAFVRITRDDACKVFHSGLATHVSYYNGGRDEASTELRQLWPYDRSLIHTGCTVLCF